MQRLLLLLSALLLAATSLSAQNRRSPQHIRAAVAQKLGATRAATLQPVIERDAVAVLSSPVSSADAAGGFAIVSYSVNTPIVLAYGDQPFDTENPSPEFLYLMDLYEQAIEAAEHSADAPQYDADADGPQSDEAWTNVGALLTTKWAQGSPYNDQCPIISGKRCVTGCVATAMAQVLNFHKLPRTMHGSKTYSYDLNGTRYTNSFDFGANTFDWSNMGNTYNSFSTSAKKSAVAKLMYACGVASNMRYTTGESGTNTWVGTDAINYFMDGIRGEHYSYDVDRILQELKAGRPVIYSGASSSGGAHCFVIDGCTADGYFHCNLGWGGDSDGNYLPTNLCGYSVSAQAIEVVYPSDYVPTYTPIAELRSKYATAASAPATTFEPNRWYVLWNSGRAGSPKTDGIGKAVTNTSGIPTGESTDLCANQLLRFVPRNGGGYYIQTGTGEYFGGVTMWGNCTSASSAINYFTVEEIQSGYFALHSNGASCYVDTNGPGSTIVGWGNTKPTDIYSNSSWQFHPVTFSDTDPSAGLGIGTGANFDNTKFYTLKNTGYSQGYLVALAEDDAHPTLRGVTQNHSDGLFAGALYHEALDVYNHGYYWQILTEGGKQYLVNYGTGKFLANQGDKTRYVFTDQKSPINIVKMADGTYRFNTGSEEKSFLCAATQFDNPAANWTYTDAGSIWQVEEAEVQRPYVAVQSVSLDAESAVLLGGRTVMLTPTVLPADASNPNVTWTTSDASVATVSTAGVVTAVGAGQALITVASQDNPALTATFSLTVIGVERQGSMGDFADNELYLLRNVGAGSNRYCQGYLVAIADDDQHPTLRGVEVIHPTHGCKDDHYKDAPDFLTPGAYWQIFTDGQDHYLYNVGTQKFLTNTGNQTVYGFTDEPTPINVTLATVGAFRFNTGTEALSYLCAATHLANPAAFWNVNDVGTYWSVEAVEGLDGALPAGTSVAPTDLFTAASRTIRHLVQIIRNLSSGQATLDEAERNARFILRRKKF